MRKLASVRKIQEIMPIKGKDRVEMAIVDGWTCMVSKADNFKSGDLCIFCEPDSVFPKAEQWGFLEKYNYRIKTQKFKDGDGTAIYSQGLVLPLTALPQKPSYNGHPQLYFKEGDDVTEQLGITQYEPTMDKGEVQQNKGKYPRWLMRIPLARKILLKKNTIRESFPTFITKTDEERIQNCPKLLSENRLWTPTEKVDGQSGTFAIRRYKSLFGYKYEFFVCSRNWRLTKDDGSSYWNMAKKYNLEKVLKNMVDEFGCEYVILQGEVVGPAIQKNKYHFKEQDLFIFNVITSCSGRMCSREAERYVKGFGLKFVPVFEQDINLNGMTVKDVLDFATGKSMLHDTLREGVVFRDATYGVMSFKAVSPEFLIKNGE